MITQEHERKFNTFRISIAQWYDYFVEIEYPFLDKLKTTNYDKEKRYRALVRKARADINAIKNIFNSEIRLIPSDFTPQFIDHFEFYLNAFQPSKVRYPFVVNNELDWNIFIRQIETVNTLTADVITAVYAKNVLREQSSLDTLESINKKSRESLTLSNKILQRNTFWEIKNASQKNLEDSVHGNIVAICVFLLVLSIYFLITQGVYSADFYLGLEDVNSLSSNEHKMNKNYFSLLISFFKSAPIVAFIVFLVAQIRARVLLLDELRHRYNISSSLDSEARIISNYADKTNDSELKAKIEIAGANYLILTLRMLSSSPSPNKNSTELKLGLSKIGAISLKEEVENNSDNAQDRE